MLVKGNYCHSITCEWKDRLGYARRKCLWRKICL